MVQADPTGTQPWGSGRSYKDTAPGFRQILQGHRSGARSRTGPGRAAEGRSQAPSPGTEQQGAGTERASRWNRSVWGSRDRAGAAPQFPLLVALAHAPGRIGVATQPPWGEPRSRAEQADCAVPPRAVPAAAAGRELDTIWQRHGEFVVPLNHLAENAGAFIQRDNVQLIKQQKLTKLKKLPLIAVLNLQIPPANFFLNKGNNQALGQNRTNAKCIKAVPACRASPVQGCGHRLPVPAGVSIHGKLICLLFIYTSLLPAILVRFLLLRGARLPLLEPGTLCLSAAQ